MRRLRRGLVPLLLIAGALCLATVAAAGDGAGDRRWAVGWDPGDYRSGLTFRHRLGEAWDVSVAAGPNDYKNDSGSRSWDTEDAAAAQDLLTMDDSRRESGWVRLAGGRRFCRDGRLTAAVLAGVTYEWSNEQQFYRSPYAEDGDLDYRNRRVNMRGDTWRFTLGLRPACAVTSRLSVEFECGLAFESSTLRRHHYDWWDVRTETRREEVDISSHAFSSYGGFEWYRLKFIFWL